MEGITVKLIMKSDGENDGQATSKNPHEKVTK
jgi:hypothetical protein